MSSPVSDVYYGQTVIDEYRWLEDRADPRVKKWNEEQNAYARSYLDAIPARKAIHSRLSELYHGVSPMYLYSTVRGGRMFFMKLLSTKQQPILVTVGSVNEPSSEKVVFDPNEFDSTNSTSVDFFVPSPNAKLVAVCLSTGGSEDGSISIFDVTSGKKLPDLVPRVNYPTGGGSVAWNSDSTGFHYTRYPHEGERPKEDLNFFQQIYFHKLGENLDEDAYVIGKEFPRIAEIKFVTSEDGKQLLATVANGDGGEFAHYYLDPSGRWLKIASFEDKIVHAAFGKDGRDLFLLSKKNSPKGQILRLDLRSSEVSLKQATSSINSRTGAIEDYELTTSKTFVLEVDGGPSRLFLYDLEGKFLREVPTEPLSSVFSIRDVGDDRVLIQSKSFIRHFTWSEFDSQTGKVSPTYLSTTVPVDAEQFAVVREYATSKDGTKVPLNIIMKKGVKLDGTNPTLLIGYGGYGVIYKPSFAIRDALWLENDGVIAAANLRGGGEFGEDWHKSGMLTKKQNVFDDFLACAAYLIREKYTRPDRLAIEGASNGGLLMGAALTQHPELFRAVVSHVGIHDMLRVELDDNGAFNVTEFGTVKDPEQFHALYGYSPYHRVVDGTKYPAILMMTGENDGRVNPAHSRKMTARLQKASTSGLPILLRLSANTGHGMGTPLDETIAQNADVFAFLFDQLGIEFKS